VPTGLLNPRIGMALLNKNQSVLHNKASRSTGDQIHITRGNRNKDNLISNARISIIDTYFPLVLNWDQSNNRPKATFDHLEYIDFGSVEPCIKERFVKDMPLLTQGNGKPWDLGNLYINWLFHDKIKNQNLHMDTIRSIVDSLLHYLRWIEHMQQRDPKIHVLYLPENQSLRITYRYRRYLAGLIKTQIIKPSTANKRINTIVDFYKKLISKKLIKSSDIKNIPFKEVEKTVRTISRIGLTSFKKISTSDLAIKVPKAPDSIELIIDGGEKLRPLSEGDQDLILEALLKRGNRTMQLLFWFSLFTGARIQTCATLRTSSIKEAYATQSHKSIVLVKVGSSESLIDTKGSRAYVLHIPTILVEQIIDYTNSSSARKLREKSFYGDTDNNYVFLTKNGDPFITSSKELEDRQNSKYSARLSLADRIDFKRKKGQAVRDFIEKINAYIIAKQPEFRRFRFHDLRASFAMNYLDAKMTTAQLKTLSNGSQVDTRRSDCLKDLSKIMGHSSESVTELYLNYRDTIASELSSSKIFTEKLYALVECDKSGSSI
jgi:integrase